MNTNSSSPAHISNSISQFPPSPYIGGKSEFVPFAPLVVNDCTTSMTFAPFLTTVRKSPAKKSVMLEYRPVTKRKISPVKSTTLQRIFQTTKLSQTSDPELTSNEKVSTLFWNESIREISDKLPSLIEIDWRASDMNSCSSCARKPIVRSWWSAKCRKLKDGISRRNYQKTYYRSLPCSLRETMDNALQEIKNCEEKRKQSKIKSEIQTVPMNPSKVNLETDVVPNDQISASSKVKSEKETVPQNQSKINSKIEIVLKNPVNKFIETQPVIRTKVCKLYPDYVQKRIMKKFFTATRDTYNLCLEEIKRILKYNKEHNIRKFPSRKILRERCINSDADIFKRPHYTHLLEVPYDIRDHALDQLLQAYQNEFDKRKENPDHTFDIKFRSSRNTQSFIVDKKAWKSSGIFYPESWTKYRIKSSERLPNKIDHAVVITRDYLGKYYISLPYKPTSRIDEKLDCRGNAPKFPRIISIDPGVRTPFTCYDPSGKIYEIGAGDASKLTRIGFHMDRLQSKMAHATHKKRCSYRKAWRRKAEKIKNLVKEFHIKTALYLCRNYEVILLPKFETQQMSLKLTRKIRSKTVRQMLTWSHYTFQVRLKQKAELFGSKVIICDEHYTSKTCSKCGYIKHDLGGAKKYNCNKCSYRVDRDKNAAKNILLRYISKNPNLSS